MDRQAAVATDPRRLFVVTPSHRHSIVLVVGLCGPRRRERRRKLAGAADEKTRYNTASLWGATKLA